MSEHTKTPWTMQDMRTVGLDGSPGGTIQINAATEPIALLGKNKSANAAFIVTAANNYDQLVKALEYCAINPRELHPESQAQFLVAQAALALAQQGRT